MLDRWPSRLKRIVVGSKSDWLHGVLYSTFVDEQLHLGTKGKKFQANGVSAHSDAASVAVSNFGRYYAYSWNLVGRGLLVRFRDKWR